MKSVVVSVPHGILFILDPKNKDVLAPAYVENELIAATDSCISVAVQPEVDGDVEVSITLGEATPGELSRAAIGDLLTPHGSLAVIIASDDQPIVQCDVPAGTVTLSVWVDDLRFPAKVVVNIEKARPVPTLVKY